jgi:hypothetical protein
MAKVADKLVTDVREIIELASNKKSVYVTVWKRCSPAAFFLSWQVRELINWLDCNRIFTTKDQQHERIL